MAARATTIVGVVSDTHLPRFGTALPRALRDGLAMAAVDRIVHLGDMTGRDVPALFEALAPFDAVAGNNDSAAHVERFGRSKVLEIDGVRIGLTHGHLGVGATTPERARRTFAEGAVAAVLFGHSHTPLIDRLPDGRLLLNPGSPTDKRREPRYSWALLRIEDGRVEAELRFFDDRSV
jgi:putative phosphoesterase